LIYPDKEKWIETILHTSGYFKKFPNLIHIKKNIFCFFGFGSGLFEKFADIYEMIYLFCV